MNNAKRVDHIDIARGIGMIMVVLGHVYLAPDIMNRIVFSVHMPLFFILSGYCFSFRPDEKWRTFLRKNVRALLVPYFITSVMVICIKVVIAAVKDYGTWETLKTWWLTVVYGSGARIEEGLENIIYPIGVIWFLLALFTGRMLLRCILHSKVPWLYALLLFFVSYISTDIIWLPFSIQPGFCSVLFLYIGYAIRSGDMFNFRKIRFPLWIFTTAVWVYCIIECGYLWMVENYYENGLLNIIGSICGTYTIVFVSQLIERYIPILRKALSFLGRITLGVMCAHLIVLDCWPRLRAMKWMNSATGMDKWVCDMISISVMTAVFTVVLYFMPVVRNILFNAGCQNKISTDKDGE